MILVQAVVLGFTMRGVSSPWSIGLFEDMVHGIADNLVLIGATIILYFEANGATPNRGRKRVLALIGGVLLIGAGIGGAWVAYERIVGTQMSLSGWTLALTSLVATLGGVWAFRIIHGVRKSSQDHLHASAIAHLIGDLAISVTVFISSLGIIFFDLSAIDSWIALLAISPWMIIRGTQILRYKDPQESDRHPDEHHH